MRGPTDNDWHNLTQPMATGSDKNLSSSASEDTPEGQEPRKKRHCSSTAPDTGRPGAAAYKPLMPIYDVKTSRKEMLQQRGLDWLTLEAKEKFDQKYETLLSRWGVKVGHQGTCILCPEEWRLTDPLELQERLQSKNLPSPGDPRAWHSYSDHATSLPRALAWFSQWPRTGIQLDNFIGCGPFKPMDASHLCHHEHCIVHLVYEPSPINHSRNACKERARFLRAESRDVPEHCDQHDPPCLMQHASLTSTEAYYIQFAVLRQARELDPLPRTPRPRRYSFPTFESALPSSFSAITVESNMLLKVPKEKACPARPVFICHFCPQAKSRHSVYAFWSHIIHKHDNVAGGEKVQAIRQSAFQWRQYWDEHSKGGKKDNRTMEKLLQIEREGNNFSWGHVQGWDLSRGPK
ncbi:MAG: hypothetical protein OHK93_001264 [Ramalina farinacea]|uniref:Zinc-binding loop region of homing endonuclease domain-containing protein n=1 Tax=Ramalina farinacea TaxID=258253 RepID=A0AA43TXI7_9LECA|nr:hypothetical protein [Ramalina farinacea]